MHLQFCAQLSAGPDVREFILAQMIYSLCPIGVACGTLAHLLESIFEVRASSNFAIKLRLQGSHCGRMVDPQCR